MTPSLHAAAISERAIGSVTYRCALPRHKREGGPEDIAIGIGKRLLSQLREDVDAAFPRDGAEPDPSWGFFVLPNTPAAPVVGLSRDPRSGHLLTPVFFVAASERWRLDDLMLGLFEGTDPDALRVQGSRVV
jgi:hypothetical protein